MYVYGVSFFESLLSGTSVRPDHEAVFVFFSTVLNDSNCTMNHEILKKKLITSQEKPRRNEKISYKKDDNNSKLEP